MKFLQKYQVVLSILLVVFLCGIIGFYISCNFSSNNYSSKVGDVFDFGIEKVNNKIENIYCNESDKNHIMSVSENDAFFLLNSGYYRIIEVSEDFNAVFYKPIFEKEELFSDSILIYKSYRKTMELTNGDIIPIRYIPYMQYKYKELFFINVNDVAFERLENVNTNNFLVFRYSQMQVLSGKIKIEKIGLIPNDLQPSY